VGRAAQLACIVLIAAGLFSSAARSLRISHAHGDQRAYVGVAMKLERFDEAPYNLRGIGMRVEDDALIYYPHFQGPGDLLRQLEREGVPSYDQDLFHAPPLFPIALRVSHATWASGGHYRVVNYSGEPGVSVGLVRGLAVQGWAVFVPVLASTIAVLLALMLGRWLGGPWWGIACAALLVAAPAFQLATQRLWADTLLAACTLATIYAAVTARRPWQFALAGAAWGLALLSKNSAAILVAPLALLFVHGPIRRPWILFAAATLLVTAPWYAKVVQVFGTPFFNPTQPGIAAEHPWFAAINARPWWTLLVGTILQNPLMGVGLVAAPWLLLRGDSRARVLALWGLSAWLALTVVTSTSEMLGPDHRYLMPAYPAFALMGLVVLERARVPSAWRIGAVVVSVLISILVTVNNLDADLILVPF